MTKAQYESWLVSFQHLALDVGIAPACRAIGIPVERGKKIAQRYHFNISKYRPKYLNSRNSCGQFTSPDVPAGTFGNDPGIEAKRRIIAHHSDRARIGAVIAGAKVFEHLADMPAPALVRPATAISADQWAKVTDRAAGWTAERQAAPSVNVAIVSMPTPEDRAAQRALDSRLDDIAQELRRTRQDRAHCVGHALPGIHQPDTTPDAS